MAILVLLILIPPLLFGLFDMSSYLPGVLVLSFSHFILAIRGFGWKWAKRVVFSKQTVIFLYIFIVFPLYASESQADLTRYCLSLIFLCILFSVSDATAFMLRTNSRNSVHYGMIVNAIILALMVALTISGYVLPWNSSREKPVFIYPEISHYVLAASPVLIYCFTVLDRKWRAIIALFVLLTLLVHPSLTLAVLLVLSIIVFVRKAWVVGLMAIAIVIVLANYEIATLEYYKSRIDFGGDNLSMLVFVSGWERAYLSFMDTFGFGLGFQQMGVYGPEGSIYETIRQLAVGDVNLYDGGSNAAKLVAELGVVGVCMLVAYANLFKESVKAIRHIFIQPEPIRKQYANQAYVYSSIISYFLELFVRGQGYFSVGLVFFMIAICMRGQLLRRNMTTGHDLAREPALSLSRKPQNPFVMSGTQRTP